MTYPHRTHKKWPPDVWARLKSITKTEMIRLLDRDPAWSRVPGRSGAVIVFHNPSKPSPFDYCGVHFHSGDTSYGEFTLQNLLADICWLTPDLVRLKFLKGKQFKKYLKQ